jgi:hypothetical protein
LFFTALKLNLYTNYIQSFLRLNIILLRGKIETGKAHNLYTVL